MSNGVTEVLQGYIRDALELRLCTDLPTVASAPVDIQTYLLDVRRRQDRVEELLRLSLRIKSRARRAADAANAAVEDAWDQAAVAARQSPVQRGNEFFSARERAAVANLEVLDLRREARRAAELAHICDEAAEVIRSAYWGLSGVREDVRELLRTHLLESHLER